MMKRMLVPVTERDAATVTLEPIVDVASNGGYTVRLLYVRPVAEADTTALPATRSIEDERPLAGGDGTQALDPIATGLRDIPVERVTRFGDVETAILQEAAAWPADLVALSAGDRMWLSRAVRTGRAARAFRRTAIPALLYTPSE